MGAEVEVMSLVAPHPVGNLVKSGLLDMKVVNVKPH
jgi:hypothetical protein